jgi:hypothetical protein
VDAKKGRPAHAYAAIDRVADPAEQICSDAVRDVTWDVYRNSMLQHFRSSLSRYARCSDDPLDLARQYEAESPYRHRRLFRVMQAAQSTCVGIGWQAFDTAFWGRHGHAAVNFGNAHQHDGADGVVCGSRIQVKLARPLIPRSGLHEGSREHRNYMVNNVAPVGTGVKNLILMISDVRFSMDWPVFYGTTEELMDTVRRVRISPVGPGTPVLGSGSWHTSERAILSSWGGSAAEMVLADYVASRNRCAL